MKALNSIEDLIEEIKLRVVWWALFVFCVTYFLSYSSKSMWMNLPLSIVLVSILRIVLNNVEFRWKGQKPVRPQSYLSHLEKKQLSLNDPRLSTGPPPPKWKRKIGSPIVEDAMKDFIDKLLKDFVIDLWYSDITPDKEAPEQIRTIIMDALGEVSGRVKEINLVNLLTRDIIDLIGDHIELFRRNQAAIGVDVMKTLSSEERDERLKHHLMASKELHPALISPESEYKVLQRLMGGVLAVVLRPREAQCPVVRSIARELLTSLVIQPVLNFASPGYINELIEYILLAVKEEISKVVSGDQSAAGVVHDQDSPLRKYATFNQNTDLTLAEVDNQREVFSDYNKSPEDPLQPRPADWARVLEAATQRRTEVLAPENLENMWTKGRNYKRKEHKKKMRGVQEPIPECSGIDSAVPARNLGKEMVADRHEISTGMEDRSILKLRRELSLDAGTKKEMQFLLDPSKESYADQEHLVNKLEDIGNLASDGSKSRLKRSNSTSALKIQPDTKIALTEGGGSIISEFYSPGFGGHREDHISKSASDMVVHSVGQQVPKLRCRVMGAYFEKLGSKSFAVYSIAVTDSENRTWFVKRRYRNFERLHRHLKDIPNYTLHLPPKRIFSSSTEDAFVHQRCIQLDKYLQDLLSIANVAEQHEVWDFLSGSSKNYSFGKSPSVMRTLAVNVDDAVDDIVRQFKGVSDGLMRKVVGPTAESSSLIPGWNLSANADETGVLAFRQNTAESTNSFSDNEEGDKDRSCDPVETRSGTRENGWHSDNELNSKSYPPRVVHTRSLGLEKKAYLVGEGGFLEDPVGMPPEWTPPNVSVPLLNLVDKVFQLKKRGWLRRQVFWMSKQILQLMMDDAIDDWLMRQIHWLRREDVIASGIYWLKDVLWPNGTFFLRIGNVQDDNQNPLHNASQLGGNKAGKPGSFEQQLEAARRASDIKKMLFDGTPTALVSLIGHKQYRRCARDIYYFTQSTICIKQLAYAILELSLVSIFPELRDLIADIHQKMGVDQTV